MEGNCARNWKGHLYLKYQALKLFFSVIDGNVFEMTEKKLSHFGQNVWKYKLKHCYGEF